MIQEERDDIVKALTAVLTDNLGNKLTVALANGILGEVTKLVTSMVPPKANALPVPTPFSTPPAPEVSSPSGARMTDTQQ